MLTLTDKSKIEDIYDKYPHHNICFCGFKLTDQWTTSPQKVIWDYHTNNKYIFDSQRIRVAFNASEGLYLLCTTTGIIFKIIYIRSERDVRGLNRDTTLYIGFPEDRKYQEYEIEDIIFSYYSNKKLADIC